MTIKQSFYDEVLMTLGGSLVDVELTEGDIDLCLKKAIRTFKQKGHDTYRNVFLKLSVVDAVDGVYKIPPNIHTVVSVLPTSIGSGSFGSGDEVFNQMVYNQMYGVGGSGSCRGCGGAADMLLYEMQEQQAEQYRRKATAGGVAFNHDQMNNTIKLLSKYSGNVVLLDAYSDLEDDEYMRIDWVIRWTIAEAKHMLGMAYRKFSGIAAPTGEASLSGSEYIQESKEEKQELLEEIDNYVDGYLDYGMITIG